MGAYFLQPPEARAIFLHDLLCNGTRSVTADCIRFGGGGHKRKKKRSAGFWGKVSGGGGLKGTGCNKVEPRKKIPKLIIEMTDKVLGFFGWPDNNLLHIYDSRRSSFANEV